jgi:tetratricopeptide (TPR) repeat protein
VEFAEKSLGLAQHHHKQLDEALAERAWGAALREAGQLPEARSHLDRSLELLQTVNSRPEIGRAYLELARWHKANGDFESMFLAALEAKKIFDELGMKGELKKVKALGV